MYIHTCVCVHVVCTGCMCKHVCVHVGMSVLVIAYSCEWVFVQSTCWTEASCWWSCARNSAKVRHSRSSVIAVLCSSPVLLSVTMCSIPVGVVLHSLERLLVSEKEREKIRRDKYLSRRGIVEQW